MCTENNQSLFINRIAYLKRYFPPCYHGMHNSVCYCCAQPCLQETGVNIPFCSLYLVDITVQ